MNSLFRTTHYFEDSTIFGDLSHAIDKTEEQFAKINEMFEEFKLNTITKDEFLSGIEDKADKEEIANIVSFYLIITHYAFSPRNLPFGLKIFFRFNEKNSMKASRV